MLIVLVRHGETTDNENQVIQGHLEGELNEKGRKQAEDLGAKLNNFGTFDQIISSDLNRAKETVTIISKEITCNRIRYEKDLRERCYGIFQGKPYFQLKRRLVKQRIDIRDFEISEGENYKEFEKRILDFYYSITSFSQDQQVILVTHEGVLQVIIEMILRQPRQKIENCSGIAISYLSDKKIEFEYL
jgi:broad specificity phosphatase PhoE